MCWQYFTWRTFSEVESSKVTHNRTKTEQLCEHTLNQICQPRAKYPKTSRTAGLSTCTDLRVAGTYRTLLRERGKRREADAGRSVPGQLLEEQSGCPQDPGLSPASQRPR